MALLEVTDLHTSFFTPAGEVKAVNGISFNLERGKVLGIVGESGSGKTTIGRALIRINKVSGGEITFNNVKISGKIPKETNL